MSLVEKALKKLQQQRAPSVTTPSDPTRFTPALPVLPFAEEVFRTAGLLPDKAQERQFTGQFRSIKQAVLRLLTESPATASQVSRTLMLTSALAGDGKSFVSVNLALSLSLECDHTVLLVDADVVKLQISTLFAAADRPGLLDVLQDETRTVESVIFATSIPGLYVLPAGTPSDAAAEWFASQRMSVVMQQLATLDPGLVVLFDSSPLLLTNEAQALAAHVQQVLMVVRAGVTPHMAVQEAVTRLSNLNASTSLLLNDMSTATMAAYAYGYYAQSSETKSDVQP